MHKSNLTAYAIIALIVLLACVGLGWLDKDTKHISDLAKADNLAGLAFYFVPTFILCLFTYKYFKKRNSTAVSIAKGVAVGIPLWILSFITILVLWKQITR